MKRLKMFWAGAISVFDLDMTYAKSRRLSAMSKLIDPNTNRARVSSAAAPAGAFIAVGNNLKHAIAEYERQQA